MMRDASPSDMLIHGALDMFIHDAQLVGWIDNKLLVGKALCYNMNVV